MWPSWRGNFLILPGTDEEGVVGTALAAGSSQPGLVPSLLCPPCCRQVPLVALVVDTGVIPLPVWITQE